MIRPLSEPWFNIIYCFWPAPTRSMRRISVFFTALLMSSCAPKHYTLVGVERTRIVIDSSYLMATVRASLSSILQRRHRSTSIFSADTRICSRQERQADSCRPKRQTRGVHRKTHPQPGKIVSVCSLRFTDDMLASLSDYRSNHL